MKATVPSSGVVTLSWGADAGAGGGISNFNGSSQSSQSFTAVDIAAVVTAPAWSTNVGTGAHTLQIPMAVGAGVTGGLITKIEHTAFSSKVDRAGDTMTGLLNFTGATGVSLAGTSGITFTGTGTLAMGTNKITAVGDPTNAQEAATKAYVDSQNSGKISGALTATRIPFATGASAVTDDASFVWDNTEKNLGVGVAAPATKLDVSGTDTDGTFRVFDQTAVSGISRSIVRAGAGQTTTNLMEWQNNAGTILSRIDSTGKFVGDGSLLTGVAGAVSGLTAGRVALSTAATTVGDSANFTFNSTTGAMGIGGTTPAITSTDAITIAAGGTNKNVVLTPSGTGYTVLNGNVGVGTSSPGTKLHISSGSGAIMRLERTNNTTAAAVDSVPSGAPSPTNTPWMAGLISSGNPSAYQISNYDGTSDTTRFAILPNGNVGIATAAPASKLHVGAAPVAAANSGLVSLASAPFDGATAGFFVGHASGTVLAANAASGYAGDLINMQVAGVQKFKVDKDGKIYGDGSTLSNLSGSLSGLTAGRVLFAGSATTATDSAGLVWDDTNKNLTISGGNAANGLYVAGRVLTTVNDSSDYFLTQTVNANAAGGSGMSMSANGNVAKIVSYASGVATSGAKVASGAAVFADSGASGGLSVGAYDAAGVIRMYAGGNTSSEQRLTILANGNVGIGTTTPASKFHVGADPTASANYGLVNLGLGAFDGATGNFFAGPAAGTVIAGNITTGYTGDLINLQVGTTNRFRVDALGAITLKNGSGDTAGIYPCNYSSSSSLCFTGNRFTQPTNGGFAIRSGAGSSTVPLYTFKNDENTGIGTTGNATHVISFTNNGVESARIDASGNLGIGATSPASKLHVGVAPTASANYGLVNLGSGFFDGATAGFFTGHASGTVLAANVAGAYGGDLINLQAAGVQKFKVDKDGKIYGDGSTLSNVSGALAGLTAGRVPFAATATTLADDSSLVWDNTNKRLAIGTASPAAPLHVVVDAAGANNYFMYDSYHTTASTNSTIMARRARGTVASPTAVQANDALGTIGAAGYGATAFAAASKVAIKMFASENWTDAAQGTYFTFETTDSGGTARSEKLRIGHNGNIGIGTTAPGGTLDVGTAAASGTNLMRIRSIVATSTASARLGFYDSNSTGRDMWAFTYDNLNNKFKLQRDVSSTLTDTMTFDGSGNVGIGTATPAAQLQVATDMLIGTTTGYISGAGRFHMAGALAEFSLQNRQVTSFTGSPTQGERFVLYNDGVPTAGKFKIWSGSDLLTLTHTGNLGIGTTSPSEKLSVSGNVYITGNIMSGTSSIIGSGLGLSVGGTNAGGNVGGNFQNSDGTGYSGFNMLNEAGTLAASIQYGNSSATLGTLQNAMFVGTRIASAPLLFVTGAGVNERMRIDSSGNVGIGTATPAAKLDVEGTVKLGTAGVVMTAIKSYTVALDFPNTTTGNCSNLDITLPDDGVVVGVKLANAPSGGTSFVTGNSASPGCTGMNTFRNDTGNTKVGVAFENASGSSVNPTSTNFTVYYIVP